MIDENIDILLVRADILVKLIGDLIQYLNIYKLAHNICNGNGSGASAPLTEEQVEAILDDVDIKAVQIQAAFNSAKEAVLATEPIE